MWRGAYDWTRKGHSCAEGHMTGLGRDIAVQRGYDWT